MEKGQTANCRSWKRSAARLALAYAVWGVSNGRTRCHGADTEPVLCSDTAMKSEWAMWVLISERDSSKFNLVTCFTLHLLWGFVQRHRLCGSRESRAAMVGRHSLVLDRIPCAMLPLSQGNFLFSTFIYLSLI
jgi:hypothetical protein